MFGIKTLIDFIKLLRVKFYTSIIYSFLYMPIPRPKEVNKRGLSVSTEIIENVKTKEMVVERESTTST